MQALKLSLITKTTTCFNKYLLNVTTKLHTVTNVYSHALILRNMQYIVSIKEE